jgi:hypothetical protein
MSKLQLTKTRMRQGVWQGILTQDSKEKPNISVQHQNADVPDVKLEWNEAAKHWLLSIPIPPEMIADGVHTLLILDQDGGEKLGDVTLIAGEALGDDIRAEMNLLRAELDMLKRAFRRHCLETG